MRKKTAEINVQELLNRAGSYVGTEHPMWFQSRSKGGEQAGTFTIEKFEPYEVPKFEYYYSWNERDDTPQSLYLGLYTITLHGCKQNKEKTFRFEVSAYFCEGYFNEQLFINHYRMDEKKHLNAYQFGFFESK